jgi:hypothetical protein
MSSDDEVPEADAVEQATTVAEEEEEEEEEEPEPW